MSWNYDRALAYLDAAQGMSLGLDAVRALAERLGAPQRRLKFVHVTGTNGKGSVSAYLASAVSACGYRVGRFSSPAVFDWRETIAVDGARIDRNCAARLVERAAAASEELSAVGIKPTRFEIETVVALSYFAERGCDLVVWEVGLGGRLDATNVVENTLAAAFTPISLDHAAILGGTVEAIAEEKAGILKRGCIALSAPQPPSVRDVMARRAEALGCPLRFAPRAEIAAIGDGVQTLRVGGADYGTRMLGAHQTENLPLALSAVEALRERGFVLPEEEVAKGIASATLAGRFQKICSVPDFWLDGAHNPAAAQVLAANVRTFARDKRVVFVVGIFRDKDVDGILDATLAAAERVITFDWAHPRALPGRALAAEIGRRGTPCAYAGDARGAVSAALAAAGKDGCVVAFGSLSHLNLIRDALTEVQNGR